MKKNMVFYKIFIPFFLLGVSLVVGFCIFIYQKTYSTIEEQFISDKETILQQIRTNIDRRIQIIEYSFSVYGSTSDFSDTFQEPLTSKNFNKYLDVRKELSYIEMMVQGENQFDLTSITGKWSIVNGSLKQLSDKDINEIKNEYIDNSTTNLYWEKKSNGIEMVLLLPMYSNNKYAVANALLTDYTLDNAIGSNSQNQLTIYNNTEILFTNKDENNSDIKQETIDSIDINEVNLFREKKGNYLLLKTGYHNWIYKMDIDSQEIKRSITNLRIGLVVISVCFSILIGIFSYIISLRFSRPFKKIQESLEVTSLDNKQIELNQVAESIKRIVGENRYLSNSLFVQQSQLETLFVLSLFRNRVDQREVEQRQEQFKYDLLNKVFYVSLIQIDDETKHGGETDLLLIAINNIVSESIPIENRLIPIVLNDEMQATIFMMNEEGNSGQVLMNYYQGIQKAINEYLQITVSVGISSKYFSLLESKKAVDYAKEALLYRINTGPQSLIFYDEIPQSFGNTSLSKYPYDLQEELFGFIRGGDEEKVIILTEQIIDSLFKENPNSISVELTVIRFINEVAELGQILGADVSIFENLKQIYMQSLSTYKPEELKTILIQQLILPITVNTQDNNELEFRSISDKLIRIIHTEFDSDLSLDTLAERLHYNPNYLSSVFKKEHGENLGDYIQSYRLLIAKRWLKETNLTIKEIAERLQYRNSQNFIRFFKKREGLTPGEYRKKFK